MPRPTRRPDRKRTGSRKGDARAGCSWRSAMRNARVPAVRDEQATVADVVARPRREPHPSLPVRPGAERREEVPMQTYETLFITSPTLTEDVERKTVDSLSDIVTEGGGTMVANERMGRRRLAYPIQKHTDGVYVRFLYDSEAAVPKELERRIRLSDNVLRALTVRLERKWAVAAKEQAVRDAQARAEAAERERLERAEAEKRAQEEAAAADAAAGATDDGEAPAEAAPAEAAETDADAAPAGEPEEGAQP